MPRLFRRAGTTLVELLITLAVMGVIMSVATMAVRRIEAPRPDDPYHIVQDSLRRAMSGSDATRFRNVLMAFSESSIASSILTSIICAPFSTCCFATANAAS